MPLNVEPGTPSEYISSERAMKQSIAQRTASRMSTSERTIRQRAAMGQSPLGVQVVQPAGTGLLAGALPAGLMPVTNEAEPGIPLLGAIAPVIGGILSRFAPYIAGALGGTAISGLLGMIGGSGGSGGEAGGGVSEAGFWEQSWMPWSVQDIPGYYVLKYWNMAGGATGYLVLDSRGKRKLAYKLADGSIKIITPKKHIVISSNPRMSQLRKLDRAHQRMSKLVRRYAPSRTKRVQVSSPFLSAAEKKLLGSGVA